MAEAHIEGEAAVDSVMRKFDRESNVRIWEGWRKWAVHAAFAMFSLYCIGMTLLSTALPELRLSMFLGLIVLVGYLIFPMRRGASKTNRVPWYDVLLMLLGSG